MHPVLRTTPFSIRPLPAHVEDLLTAVVAPPRLVAHLALVHDVAATLTSGITRQWPTFRYDQEAVLVGAATHDIGKIIYREELRTPGTRHEEVGEGLLLDYGFPPHHARFARTHGGATRELAMQPEDWLVMLADGAWKAARHEDVEDGVGAAISVATGAQAWEIYLHLDEMVQSITASADARLAWHSAQST